MHFSSLECMLCLQQLTLCMNGEEAKFYRLTLEQRKTILLNVPKIFLQNTVEAGSPHKTTFEFGRNAIMAGIHRNNMSRESFFKEHLDPTYSNQLSIVSMLTHFCVVILLCESMIKYLKVGQTMRVLAVLHQEISLWSSLNYAFNTKLLIINN